MCLARIEFKPEALTFVTKCITLGQFCRIRYVSRAHEEKKVNIPTLAIRVSHTENQPYEAARLVECFHYAR